MQHTQVFSKPLQSTQQILLATAFLLACNYIKIPFYPVSFTLHTFGIALCALLMSPRRTFAAVTLFILCKMTMGLSFMQLSGGFYMAFPLAGFIISSLKERFHPLAALVVGQLVIYAIGASWLSMFIGWKAGWIQGAGLFACSDLLKNIAALKIAKRGSV